MVNLETELHPSANGQGSGAIIEQLLQVARSREASDLHLIGGDKPRIRVARGLDPIGHPISAETIVDFLTAVGSERSMATLKRRGSMTCAYVGPYGQIRVHAYKERRGLRLAIRILMREVPRFDKLGFPGTVSGVIERPGLIIVCGPTGAGKSTLHAAFVDRITERGDRTVITIEDPVEYRFEPPASTFVAQREVGVDVSSYGEGVRDALRGDPRVIVVGEVRDADSAKAVMEAADTGHLVIATMHTGDATQSVDRLLAWFPSSELEQRRTQISQVLNSVIALRLVPTVRGSRVPAFEIMVANDSVRTTIKNGHSYKLRNIISTARAEGMVTLEDTLNSHVRSGQVRASDAKAAAMRPSDIIVQ
jgi:twitching motility protein PilT